MSTWLWGTDRPRFPVRCRHCTKKPSQYVMAETGTLIGMCHAHRLREPPAGCRFVTRDEIRVMKVMEG